MNDDDLVTLEVQVPADDVRKWASGISATTVVNEAARRWVEEHDRPERRTFLLPTMKERNWDDARTAVVAEDLRPGDWVAGREVTGVENLLGFVRVELEGQGCNYAPGTLVVLDGDR